MAAKPKADNDSETNHAVGARMMWVRELIMPNRAECARLIGVDTSTLCRYEEGDRAVSLPVLIAYSKRFEVPTDFFLMGRLDGVPPLLLLRLCADHPELTPQLQGMGMGKPSRGR